MVKRRMPFAAGALTVWAAIVLVALTGTAAAQQAPEQDPRGRLRQRYAPRGNGADLNDVARKLRSDSPEDRLEATRMLATSDDPKSVEYLLSAATDADIRVRIKAIDELGNRRATDATPLFVQQLFLRETEPVVQQRVLAALGKIADPRSTQPICDFLSRDLDMTTRGTAIFALGEIGDETALSVLSKLAGDGSDPITSRLADEAARKITRREPPTIEIRALAEDRRR